MFYQATLANTISAINVAKIAHASTVTVPVTKYSLTVLERLVDVGVLFKYELVVGAKFPRKAVLHLAYISGAPAVKHIRLISTGAKVYTIKLATLLRNSSKFDGYIILLNTSRGILTVQEAIHKKVGGQLLIEIVY